MKNEEIRDGVSGVTTAKALVEFLTANGVDEPLAYMKSAVYSKAKDAVYRMKRNVGLKILREKVVELEGKLASK